MPPHGPYPPRPNPESYEAHLAQIAGEENSEKEKLHNSDPATERQKVCQKIAKEKEIFRNINDPKILAEIEPKFQALQEAYEKNALVCSADIIADLDRYCQEVKKQHPNALQTASKYYAKRELANATLRSTSNTPQEAISTLSRTHPHRGELNGSFLMEDSNALKSLYLYTKDGHPQKYKITVPGGRTFFVKFRPNFPDEFNKDSANAELGHWYQIGQNPMDAVDLEPYFNKIGSPDEQKQSGLMIEGITANEEAEIAALEKNSAIEEETSQILSNLLQEDNIALQEQTLTKISAQIIAEIRTQRTTTQEKPATESVSEQLAEQVTETVETSTEIQAAILEAAPKSSAKTEATAKKPIHIEVAREHLELKKILTEKTIAPTAAKAIPESHTIEKTKPIPEVSPVPETRPISKTPAIPEVSQRTLPEARPTSAAPTTISQAPTTLEAAPSLETPGLSPSGKALSQLFTNINSYLQAKTPELKESLKNTAAKSWQILSTLCHQIIAQTTETAPIKPETRLLSQSELLASAPTPVSSAASFTAEAPPGPTLALETAPQPLLTGQQLFQIKPEFDQESVYVFVELQHTLSQHHFEYES